MTMKKTMIRFLYIQLCIVTIASSCSRDDGDLQLDENIVPLKITEAGFYSYSGADGDFSNIGDGLY